MSPHIDVGVPVVIIALKTLTLLLGGAITYLAYKAYQRTEAKALGYLALGFGFVTLGSLLAGLIDQVLELGFELGQLTQTALVVVGFAVILYSLYAED